MIINKGGPGVLALIMYKACYRFARHSGLEIIENHNDEFTLKLAADDDDVYWISKTAMDTHDMEEFVRMGLSYSKNFDKIAHGRITISIDCPNCKYCNMTPKQFIINSIQLESDTFVICNNCGEVIHIDEKVHIEQNITKEIEDGRQDSSK